MKGYTIEVFTTENIATKTLRYYKVVLGVARRISQADYDKLDRECDGLNCIYTVKTKTHIKHYKTLVFYM